MYVTSILMCAYTSACRLCGVYTLIYVAAVCRRILSGKIIGQIFLLLNKLAKLQFPIAVQNIRQKRLQQHTYRNAHMHACMCLCTCMPCSVLFPLSLVRLCSAAFVCCSYRRLRLCRRSLRIAVSVQSRNSSSEEAVRRRKADKFC